MCRRKIEFLFHIFSMITSCMVIAVALFTTVINPTERILSTTLWQIVAVAAVLTVPSLIYPWDRSMGKTEIAVRTVIHYVLVNVIVLVSGRMFDWYSAEDALSVAAMLVTIAVIFAIVSGISWSKSARDAKRMNERLKGYAKKAVDNSGAPMYNESVCEDDSY